MIKGLLQQLPHVFVRTGSNFLDDASLLHQNSIPTIPKSAKGI
jgi:hypothetical protein